MGIRPFSLPCAMPSITSALAIETEVFSILNVYQVGEPVSNADAQGLLRFLNRMLGAWALQNLTIPAIARDIFPIVAGKGGPSNPYTIGTGGDLNIARPPTQSNITGAGLLLNASVPLPVEIPRTVLTDDAWQAIQIKDLTSTLFTSIYYNAVYANSLGTINLWPIPDNTLNSLVLYTQKALVQFADLTTQYVLPDGMEEAIIYNLARRAAKPWGATVDSDLAQMATNSLSQIKRSNVKMADMPNDFAGISQRPFGYDIQTGNM